MLKNYVFDERHIKALNKLRQKVDRVSGYRATEALIVRSLVMNAANMSKEDLKNIIEKELSSKDS